MKKNTFIIGFVLCLVAVLGFSNQILPNRGNLVMKGDHSYDVNNPYETVGNGDYVFVALIEEELGNNYPNLRETHDGLKGGDFPFSEYSITVIDNIKGKLKKNQSIELSVLGGITYDQKSTVTYEGLALPEVGKYYIIVANGDPNLGLVAVNSNTVIELPYDNKSDIISSKEYKDYMKYYKDEVKIERKRFGTEFDE
ncbi:hypothetical protein [Abyssisolibacter fermentans]|uniref:hypothetical protein n=1 Tax=Abyssisolibacter fermentans TaxID=1766203 RepID=UPI000835A18B|nr:hypothetical protein [Abyssisolibacter fermentans]